VTTVTIGAALLRMVFSPLCKLNDVETVVKPTRLLSLRLSPPPSGCSFASMALARLCEMLGNLRAMLHATD
jgi:hypothetical protein